jgi:hypothetical protein
MFFLRSIIRNNSNYSIISMAHHVSRRSMMMKLMAGKSFGDLEKNCYYSVSSSVGQAAAAAADTAAVTGNAIPTDTAATSMPSAFDNVVRITFVDASGASRKVSAYIGR